MKFFKKLFCIVLLLPSVALAQSNGYDGGLSAAAGDTNLFQGNLVGVIKGGINAILGLLGVIFLILMLRGGFLWMTSVGNADKVTEAKQTIINAAIGVVIVIASYAIVRFVFENLINQTAGEVGGGTEGEGGG